MARHRTYRRFTFSHARHRGPGRLQRVTEHAMHSIVVAAAAAMLVMAMLGSDPILHSRN